MPGLLLAEEVAGAAEIEIAGADGEAGADAVQRFQGSSRWSVAGVGGAAGSVSR